MEEDSEEELEVLLEAVTEVVAVLVVSELEDVSGRLLEVSGVM